MTIQYLTNDKGERTAVQIPIEDYNQMLEHLEELEDIKLFDEAMKEDDGTRISMEEAFKIVEQEKSKVK